MFQTVPVDETRKDIRHTFTLWDIDPSEFEILWEEDPHHIRTRLPGAIVRYLRNGAWQTINCYAFPDRATNLRQCFLLLERLRIAEKHGVQYAGLTYTTDITLANKEQARKEEILEAYDVLGVSPDDPIDLVNSVFRKKSMFYHPDKGGSDEKFKKLKAAYDKIRESRA